jgi:hypothetical protein
VVVERPEQQQLSRTMALLVLVVEHLVLIQLFLLWAEAVEQVVQPTVPLGMQMLPAGLEATGLQFLVVMVEQVLPTVLVQL